MKRTLDEEDRSTLVSALRVAAERYREDVEKILWLACGDLSGADDNGLRRLAEQFKR